MGYIRLIDPSTGKVIFDSDDIIPEQLDEERDHIVAGNGWSLMTPEQLEKTIDRPFVEDCDMCEGIGAIKVLDDIETCPDCHGISCQ